MSDDRIQAYVKSIRQYEMTFGTLVGAETVQFDGPCPFLTCREIKPHIHYICPQCGAVKFGNRFCPLCQEYQGMVLQTQKVEVS